MSYQPSATKRRRLNDPAASIAAAAAATASTLSRPFKSPLRHSLEKANQGRSSPLAGQVYTANKVVDDDGDRVAADVIFVESKTASSPPPQSPTKTPSPTKQTHNAAKHELSSSPSKPNPRSTARLNKPFTSPRKKSGPLLSASSVPLATRSAATGRTTDAASRAQIASLRSDVDTLKQASRILAGNRPAELSELITTWKRVVREAAEEVFAGVKDRVNRMGGVGAWRDIEKVKKARQKQWDAEAHEAEQQKKKEELTREIVRAAKAAKPATTSASAAPSNGLATREAKAHLPAEHEDEAAEEDEDDEEMEAAAQKEAETRITEERQRQQNEQDDTTTNHNASASSKGAQESDEQEVLEDDDEFTMDMMLRALNVDLDVIGFDKAEQRWVE